MPLAPDALTPPPDKVPATYTGRRGYYAAGPAFRATREHMVYPSTNMVLDPQTSAVRSRKGFTLATATNLGAAAADTAGADLVTGIDLRSWQRFGQSMSIAPSSGFQANPIWRVLVGDDSWTEVVKVGAGVLHIGPNGVGPADVLAGGLTDAILDKTGGTGSEYMTPTYGSWIMPFCGDGRQITNSQHQRQANGGRATIEVGHWLALAKKAHPLSGDGVPLRWNLEFNVGAANYPVGTSNPDGVTQLLPVGHIPPIQPVTFTPHAAAGGSWAVGYCYYTVLFEWEDGSITPAVQWRPAVTGAILPGGWCRFQIAAVSDYVDVTFPPGPRGVKARWLCRSPVAATPDPYLIQLTHVIENNTETSYRDYFGGDEALENISDVLRLDPMWMPECRYLWGFDQRIACAHTRPSRGGILIAPQLFEWNGAAYTGLWENKPYTRDCLIKGTGGAFNGEGGSSTFRFYTRVTASTIEFYLWDGDPAFKGAPAATSMLTRDTLTITGLTLQDVVDHINNRSATTAWGTAAGVWATAQLHNRTLAWTVAGPLYGALVFAQLAPGADPGAPATELLTYGDVPAANTASTAKTFGDKFRIDTNGFTNFQEYNLQRAYGNQLPGLMVMNEIWAQRWRPGTKKVFFTGGGPGVAANALNNWYASNERSVLDECGDIVGGAALLDGCLVFSTSGVSVMRNIRDGKTGLDEDYRLEKLPGFPGCIAPDSIVERNGAIVWLSRLGLLATDGERVVNIARDIYNPLGVTGTDPAEWNYAIEQAAASLVDGDDDARFGCSFIGKRLWVWYPYSGGGDAFKSMLLDLSESQADSGLEQFLDKNGDPVGWSSPLPYGGLAAHGVFHDGTNEHHYALHSPEARPRVGEFETGVDDIDTAGTHSAIVGTAYFLLDLFGTDRKKSPAEYVVRYRDDSGSRVYLEFCSGWTWASAVSIELPLTTAGLPGDQLTRDFPLAGRNPADVVWLRFRDTGRSVAPANVGPAHFWGVDIAVSLLAARL